MSKTNPFQAPSGTPIIGQPITIHAMRIPIDLTLTCNCQIGNAPMVIEQSTPVQCQACGKHYNADFNPQTGVQVHVSAPTPEGVPS